MKIFEACNLYQVMKEIKLSEIYNSLQIINEMESIHKYD